MKKSVVEETLSTTKKDYILGSILFAYKKPRERYKYKETVYITAMLANKKDLLIALALTALLLISGCIDFSPPTTSTVTPSHVTSSTVSPTTITSSTVSTSTTESLVDCDKIQDQAEKDSCYLDVAKEKQDLSICDKVQYSSTKDSCYLDVAILKQDPSICEKIQDKAGKYSSCYAGVARVKQDPSICEKIQDQDARNYCVNHV